ncbi:DNA polymerase IV [Microlunatus ginsengisoli]|uniref:DNA polymerase IV n=1 Tax=Microlunatus ginsengisoli TaxID=363863 RepID=A0ABP6ZSG1_9ACTN
MRREASILHLDLDAFFASVEQRDKPSLRGKPVIVGGIGQRGVVATASYEARRFGVRSAMPAHEARRRCPHAAFLAGRFGAYRAASEQVMAVLRDLSPLVEPLSLDEAFVDLAAANRPVDLSPAGLESEIARVKRDVATITGGLTASVGAAGSKFMAKLASELAKPDGVRVIEPGSELGLLAPMSVGVIPGVGPVTAEKLSRLGLRTIADLRAISVDELAQTVGRTHAQSLVELAHARDDRPVVAEREAKSISVEDTFETDLVDRSRLLAIVDRDARSVATRLRAAGLFARTVTIKVRMHDFSTHTRSRSLLSATDDPDVLAEIARSMLSAVDVSGGVRLLGAGVAGLTGVLQEGLFDHSAPGVPDEAVPDGDMPDGVAGAGDAPEAVTVGATEDPAGPTAGVRQRTGWPPGADVRHDEYGDGWVWGSGLGRVTVRFETRDTPPGPVRTFDLTDPALHSR